VRPPAGAERHRRFPHPPAGQDVDDASEGVRTVEGALGTAEDFDPFDAVEGHVGEVEGAGRVDRIVQGHAVQEDENMFRIRPPDENGRSRSRPAVADEAQAGRVAESVEDGGRAGPFEILPGDDRDGAGDLDEGRFKAGGRDDDLVAEKRRRRLRRGVFGSRGLSDKNRDRRD